MKVRENASHNDLWGAAGHQKPTPKDGTAKKGDVVDVAWPPDWVGRDVSENAARMEVSKTEQILLLDFTRWELPTRHSPAR